MHADKARHAGRNRGPHRFCGPAHLGAVVADEGDEEAGRAVVADLARAVAIVGHDRFSCRERLRQGARQAFAAREVDEAIHQSHVSRDLGRRHQAGEDEVPCQARRSGHLLEPVAPWPVAHEQEADAWDLPDHLPRDGEDVVVAFELEETRDLADDEVAFAQPELRGERGVAPDREIRRQVEAAEDPRVLVGPSDTGGEVLFCHGIGHGDEVVGHAPGDPLGGGEDGVRERALERPEARSMDAVDDDRDPGLPRREPAQDPGLAAVGVDEVGALLAEYRHEPAVGEPIGPRPHRPDQLGHPREATGGGHHRFKGPFASGGRAGDQVDLEAGLRAQPEDGRDGVLLGAADDQPRDDVGDAHGAELTGRSSGGRHGRRPTHTRRYPSARPRCSARSV